MKFKKSLLTLLAIPIVGCSHMTTNQKYLYSSSVVSQYADVYTICRMRTDLGGTSTLRVGLDNQFIERGVGAEDSNGASSQVIVVEATADDQTVTLKPSGIVTGISTESQHIFYTHGTIKFLGD